MGRWRPPSIPGSHYITPAGHRRLTLELDHLWRKLRPEVTAALAAAAAEGDRSENAEYIYRKKQLREIDSRVRHLRKRLEGMRIVATRPSDPQRVFFGAWVMLEDDAGDTHRYRIVGPDEFDHEPGYISMDAPLARALMGKSSGDEISVSLPAGQSVYAVLDVSYGTDD
jgi:transcription elongation factor GreB